MTLLLAVCLGYAETTTAADAPAVKPGHRTDWFHEARWGVMFHYTCGWQGCDDVKVWSDALDAFDVKGLAKQLDEIGAGYLLITSKHGGRNPLAPNTAYEKTVPNSSPRRDLIADLADELAKVDIHLMLYYATGMGVDKPKVAKQSAAAIREYSLRYKDKVKGWWFDNNCGDRELQKRIADAARAGNPDAIIGFSPPKWQQRNSPYEDYTAGNTHEARRAKCAARFVQGVQWHMLSYLGHSWAGSRRRKIEHGDFAPRYSQDRAIEITTDAVRRGGVVTWDVPPLKSGLIHAKFIPHLKAVGRAVRATNYEPLDLDPGPRPKAKPLPPLPKGATAITLVHAEARQQNPRNDWSLERQREGLGTAVGVAFHHFIRSQLQFDLSKLDRKRAFVAARLHLYLKDTGTMPAAGNPMIVSRFSDPVNDAATEWYAAKVSDEGQQQVDARWTGELVIDVTDIVEAWLDGEPNQGFRLTAVGLGSNWRRFPFTYKKVEHRRYDAKTNPRGPRLVIWQMPR
jgi:hypothetical protein